MNEPMTSACAQAYLLEYATPPLSRTERDRYDAFKLGWQAGYDRGRRDALTDAAHTLNERAQR